jgi:multicomponent Na+:H+ antiporter subunit E
MKMFLVNIILAVIWIGLSQEQSGSTFFVGMVTGWILISLFEGFFQKPSYTRRTIALINYLFFFIKALVISNITILKNVIFTSNKTIEANLVEISVKGLTQLEILILTHSLTLTPGTTTIDLQVEEDKIIIHAFDGRSQAEVQKSVDMDLTRHILSFTR